MIFGGPRHLDLVGAGARGRAWPVPFSIAPVLACRGRRVTVLASGDPFWHGVGGTLARHLAPEEWRCLPAPSCVSLAAARLGWRLEEVAALGLHAAEFDTLLPCLGAGRRILCTLRDGAAPAMLARWLMASGAGESEMILLEALGGPRERIRRGPARDFETAEAAAPVLAGLEIRGMAGPVRAPGRDIDAFDHDGQITKGPMRALTLAALQPRWGGHLWDIGAGSGSVSVEWALAAEGSASAIEPRADRCARIGPNAARHGVGARVRAVEGRAPAALDGLRRPDAVFVGGGADDALLAHLWAVIPAGARLVVNAVTLECQTLVAQWHGAHPGGELLRVDIARAGPLGRMQGWQPARPQLQWSITR